MHVYASVHMIVSVLFEPRRFWAHGVLLWDRRGAENKSSTVRRGSAKIFSTNL